MKEISIADSIPHRGPMLLLDEVLECSTEQITCGKSFRDDEFFFQGHYPENPLVPGVILCECAAQAAAVLIANIPDGETDGIGNKVPVLARMNRVKFKNTVHPGDRIVIQVKLAEVLSGTWFLKATIRNNDKLSASLELSCTLVDREKMDSPNSPGPLS